MSKLIAFDEEARRSLESAEASAADGGGAPTATGEPAPGGDHAEDAVAGPTMLALLRPELPEVRARRARAENGPYRGARQ